MWNYYLLSAAPSGPPCGHLTMMHSRGEGAENQLHDVVLWYTFQGRPVVIKRNQQQLTQG